MQLISELVALVNVGLVWRFQVSSPFDSVTWGNWGASQCLRGRGWG